MVEDVVRTLGFGTLGSRLKRIGERLQAQTQDVASELAGTDIPAPHFPVLAALDRNGSLSIGELSRALGQTQPGVSRMINKMKESGLVEARADDGDRRVSNITLTRRGKEQVEHFKQLLWPTILLAVQDACSGLEGPLLDQLAQLEETLTERPLKTRIPASPAPGWNELTQPKEIC